MQNTYKITNDLYNIGASDRTLSLFESVYPVPKGASYNSYLLMDDKTILFDTVDKSVTGQFFENLDYLLSGKTLDYMIINHLEPDHSANIKNVISRYKGVKIVANQKIKDMLTQFFEFDFNLDDSFIVVKEGDTLKTQNHEFTFVSAPMVHWPEVMVTYDTKDKILFSADAFGSFGAIEGNLFDDEVELDISEYRRYYTNIVGKYGAQVSNLLKKAQGLEIKMICPLHGVIVRENIPKFVELYSKWATYTPEINSVLVLYSSVYGNTQNCAEIVASNLAKKGIKNIAMYDVSMTHDSYLISSIFKYSHVVIATTTYNNNIFVTMENLLSDVVNHNIQNRTFAIIQNGSWMPNCENAIILQLEKLKNCKILNEKITIKSSLKSSQKDEIEQMVNAIVEDLK